MRQNNAQACANPRCEHWNRRDASYCARCGQPMPSRPSEGYAGIDGPRRYHMQRAVRQRKADRRVLLVVGLFVFALRAAMCFGLYPLL